MSRGPAGNILVVDDSKLIRTMLCRQLEQDGHTVSEAENGKEALDILRSKDFDLLLLDMVMPELNGYETLLQIKADPELRHLPVIVLSANEEQESAVRCIESGAEDYLPKPFDVVLLRARIGASLVKKRFVDVEKAYLDKLRTEQENSERLLLNVLPKAIATRLKEGQRTIADSFPDVSVLFADLVGFSRLSADMTPAELVHLMNDVFSAFDRLAEYHGLEKIKTIGDAYMVAGGLPVPREGHAEAIARMGLAMVDTLAIFRKKYDRDLGLRIGIHVGPVVAGVIGTHKFAYDLWGDTVNVASRMESHGVVGRVQVSEATFHRLKDTFRFEDRGQVDVKGMGTMSTYLLAGLA
ncbi:MAG TPA: adenylate/guanylate cyclase domain-containing protein [Stenomitos sp.]